MVVSVFYRLSKCTEVISPSSQHITNFYRRDGIRRIIMNIERRWVCRVFTKLNFGHSKLYEGDSVNTRSTNTPLLFVEYTFLFWILEYEIMLISIRGCYTWIRVLHLWLLNNGLDFNRCVLIINYKTCLHRPINNSISYNIITDSDVGWVTIPLINKNMLQLLVIGIHMYTFLSIYVD